jgi:hypothetical protein
MHDTASQLKGAPEGFWWKPPADNGVH